MTEYLWIRPSKAIETIQGEDEEFGNAEKRLWEAVVAGIIRIQLNGVDVPEAHVEIYLRMYSRLHPTLSSFTISPDTLVYLPAVRAAFQGVRPAKHRVGRPTKISGAADLDRILVHEMHRRVATGQARSRTEAAWQLESEGKITRRNDLAESRVKRLTRLFAVLYTG